MATATTGWFKKRKTNWIDVANAITLAALIFGTVSLLALIWQYVRPVQLANIKVPVATDQSSYHPGEEISGIFFGEIYHQGEVRVLREVFCKGYKNIITPPQFASDGDFYDTQSIPRKVEGLTVTIGQLPENIPVGLNCVLQFTNVYRIQTPFGVRHEEYQYYTQNFSIVTLERRQQLECEAAGRTDCDLLTDDEQAAAGDDPTDPTVQSSPDSPEMQEPAPRFVERCIIDFIVQIGCRQVEAR